MNPLQPMPNLPWWTNPTMPTTFENGMSNVEMMRNMVNNLQTIFNNQQSLNTTVYGNTEDIKSIQETLSTLTSQLASIENGENAEIYIQALSKWIDSNLQQLVGRVVQYVFFGLSADGRFTAYIPESWKWLSFDTCMEPKSPMYGHLILKW